MKIIALEGSRAVGKTTLVENLRKLYPDLLILKGYKYNQKKFNLLKEDDFCENQKIYINQKIEQYSQLKKIAQNTLVVRGVEDIEFFTLHHPKIYGFDWDMERNMRDELIELRKYQSDIILYLDASKETILKRKDEDVRKRDDMDFWLNNWLLNMKQWFSQYSYTHFVDTDTLSKEEVAIECIKLMKHELI